MNQWGKILALFFLLTSAIGILLIWNARQSNERAAWTPGKKKQNAPIVSLIQPSILVSDPTKGVRDAPITIVEFADFRCPHCVDTKRDITKLFTDNPEKIRFVWKDFPIIPPREDSLKAHTAARCAQMQDKFWEYHDDLFDHQNTLSESQLLASAEAVGLKMDQFQSCITNATTKLLVERSFAEGQNLGIDGTPTIYVNGKKWEKSIMEIYSSIK